jgi:hypothetical protein
VHQGDDDDDENDKEDNNHRNNNTNNNNNSILDLFTCRTQQPVASYRVGTDAKTNDEHNIKKINRTEKI